MIGFTKQELINMMKDKGVGYPKLNVPNKVMKEILWN